MARERQLRIQIIGDSKSAEQAFGSIEKSAGGLSEKLGTLGKVAGAAMIGVAGAAAVGAGKSIQAFIGFENQMNEVFTLLPGVTADAMDAMTGEVLNFSKEFGTLPQDVVPALYNSLSAGVPPDNVFAFLETAQKAAVGGVTDLNTAVDAMSTVVNSFGADTISAGEASDLLFTAVRLGKTTFDELGGSISNVAPIAAAMGVEFGDVTAALAALTAQGVPTSVATTQLRSAISELGKEGTEVSNVFKDVAGESFQDFIANGGNLQTALQALEQHAKDNNLSMVDLFSSIEAGQAALALTGKGTDAFTNAMEEMENAAGATEAAYEQMDSGLQRNIDKIRANFEAMKLQVGQQLAPAFASFTGFVLDTVLPALGDLASTAQDKLGPALDFLVDVGGRLKDAFSEGGLSGVLSELPGIAADIGSAIFDAILGLDWAGMGGSAIGLLVEGLKQTAGLVTDVTGWIWDTFKAINWTGIGETIVTGVVDGIKKVGSFVGDVAGWLWDAVKDVNYQGIGESLVTGILSGVTAVGNFATDIGTWLWDSFTDLNWTGIGQSIVDGVLTGVTAAANFAADIGTWLYDTFTAIEWMTIGQSLVDGLMTGVSAVADFATRIGEWIGSAFSEIDWSGIATSISDGVGTAIAASQSIALGVAEQLQGFDWGAVGDSITGGVGSAIDAAGGLLGNINIDGIISAIQPLLNVMSPMFEMIKLNLSVLPPLWRELANSVMPLIDALKPLEALLLPIAAIIGTVLVVAITALVLSITGLVAVISVGLVGALKVATVAITATMGVFQTLGILIEGVVKTIAAVITGDFSGALKVMQDTTERANQAIMTMFTRLRDLVVGTISDLVGGVIGFFQNLYDTLVGNSIIPDLINGIINWFKELPGQLISLMSDFVMSILGFFSDLVTDGLAKAGELVDGVLDAFLTMFVDGPKRIFDTVVAVVGELAKMVTDGVAKAVEFVTGLLDEIGTLITDGPAKIVEMAGAIAGEMDQLIRDAAQWGADFVAGLVKGITDNIPSLSDAAGAVTDAVGWGIGKLKGQSPSPMGIEIGHDFTDGVVVGIEDGIPKVEITAAHLASAVVEGVSRDVSRLPELLEDTGVAFALEIDKMRVAAEEALILARLRGDSEEEIAKLQADLDLLTQILEAWVEDSQTTIAEAYRFAITQEQRNNAIASYESLLSDLEGLASGEVGTRLGQELADLLNLQRIAEQAGEFDLAAHYAGLAEAKSEELRMAGELMATPIVQGMTESFNADQLAAEWDQRLADALSGPGFGENLQASIDDLDQKLNLAPLMDVPQHVVDGWEAQKDELTAQSEQYWRDVAQAAAAGLLDEQSLAAYAKAGGEQFQAYLVQFAGPEAAKQLVGSVKKMSGDAVAELKSILRETPEIAGKFVDDLVKGMHAGAVDLRDVTAMLAHIPAEEIGPELERLRHTYQQQLAQAVAEGNDEMAEGLRELLYLLGLLDQGLGKAGKSASGYANYIKEAAKWQAEWEKNTVGSGSSGGGGSSRRSGGSSGGSSSSVQSNAKTSTDPKYASQPKLSDYQTYDAYQRALEAWAARNNVTLPGSGGSGTAVIENNITLQVDGEPVAKAVNRVNTHNMTMEMGPT